MPNFRGLIASADVTLGTDNHTADVSTMNSYRDIIALRDNSRRAGRVWADKSVLTDDAVLTMQWDGYNGSVSNDEDFLHVFSALGSSQVEDTIQALDVVFILDTSALCPVPVKTSSSKMDR